MCFLETIAKISGSVHTKTYRINLDYQLLWTSFLNPTNNRVYFTHLIPNLEILDLTGVDVLCKQKRFQANAELCFKKGGIDFNVVFTPQ